MKWTDADIARLRAEYPKCSSVAELAQRMGRTERHIMSRANNLMLSRCPHAFLKARSNGQLMRLRRASPTPKPVQVASVPDLMEVWR